MSASYFDICRPNQHLVLFLAGCEYVCSVLPSTAETNEMFSRDVLKACQENVNFDYQIFI